MKNTREKIIKIVKQHKYLTIILITLLMWSLIPPFINFMVNKPAIFLSNFFGYVDKDNYDAWIGFYGDIIGGVVTMLGVAWTIIDQNKKRNEDIKDSVKPILVANGCSYEKVKKDGMGKVFECILEYKNIGRGILYNPRIMNIEYLVDNKTIGQLQPGLSIKNYMDIDSTVSSDIMIIFTHEELSNIFESLKGRGNTIPVQIVIYVGGKDMYGRDIVTKMDYHTALTFFSVEDIQTPLQGGNLTSIVLFDEEEISEVVENANKRYNVYR